jgi:hypothetical protein
MPFASLTDVVSTSASTVAVIAALGYLARTWAASKIQEAVKADYQGRLEELKEELRRDSARRRRAAAIADFLAAWVADNFDPSKRNNVALLEVQRKYWELALWLDAPTLRELNRGLMHEGDHLAALVQVRKAIVGEETEQIKPDELIRWQPLENWSAGNYPRPDASGETDGRDGRGDAPAHGAADDASDPPIR